MSSDDSAYRREEDRKWREKVDDRLVSLTSAQKTTDDELDKHEERIENAEILLEGDELKEDDEGVVGDVEVLMRKHNEIRAIWAPDNLGEGGWENRLRAVENELGIKRKTRLNRKAFAAAVGIALASTTGFVVSNWDKVESMAAWVGKRFQPASSQVVQKGARAGAPRKRVVKVRIVPPDESALPAP